MKTLIVGFNRSEDLEVDGEVSPINKLGEILDKLTRSEMRALREKICKRIGGVILI